jgi:anhydro-N-acetylmuramic acid kinase
MRRLQLRLAPLRVRSIADYGIPRLAKEPAAFALMAWLAVNGKVNHLPAATGARGPRILGKVTQ